MINYNEKLDELFVRWEQASKQNGDDEVICKDGLMRKRDWDVNELWHNSKKRIMFLLKDQPDGGGDDTRNWLVLPEDHPYAARNNNVTSTFLKRLAWLLCAFLRDEIDYWSISHEQAAKFFNERPFAFIETKKQSGGTSIDDKTMWIYLERYKDFILEEISILNPNIIVCCGGPQYDFALTTLYKKEDLECIDKNVHYDKEHQKVIIYAPHPSVRCADAKYFEGVMWHYGEFLKKHPNF